MKVAIMQPYLFPYIGYWQLIASVDTFVIYDDVHYIKKGYINKNNILINEKMHRITLEVLNASQNSLINELNIGMNNMKLLKTIKITYQKAPYFQFVYPLLEEILCSSEKNLAKFVGFSIEKISHFLEIDTKILYSSNIKQERNVRKEDRLISIVKELEATEYINAIGGQKLYTKEMFQHKNINLYFLETNIIPYIQFQNDFVPYLSIIDILMFNDLKNIKMMLSNYTLI